jgi:hypothetical protein
METVETTMVRDKPGFLDAALRALRVQGRKVRGFSRERGFWVIRLMRPRP